MLKHKLLSASAAVAPVFIEDVFSTYLYTGAATTITVNNGIDLTGEGGMVWIKDRITAGTSPTSTPYGAAIHYIFDTLRTNSALCPSSSVRQDTTFSSQYFNFLSNGFDTGTLGNNLYTNVTGNAFTSWTFRQAPRFFDVVTYTGTGANRTIAHTLDVVPGCIMVKRTDTTGDWQVYHRSNTAAPETDYLVLNSTAATVDDNTRWNDTLPTSTVFSLGTATTVNASGGTYVAYLFAHDPLGPSGDGSDGLIACGSYTGAYPSNVTVELGWEPQWLLIKNASQASNWCLVDTMRGIPVGVSSATPTLAADSAAAENGVLGSADVADLTPTGFIVRSGLTAANVSGNTHIYIAIRRGPMREPTSGTEVFSPTLYTGTNVDNRLVNTGLLTDMAWVRQRNDAVLGGMVVGDRLRGQPYLLTGTTAAEVNDADSFDQQIVSTTEYGTAFSSHVGFYVGNDVTSKLNANTTSNNHIAYSFRRAPGFFDVVAYTGNGVQGTNIPHNLGVAPDLMIVKKRDALVNATSDWRVYVSGITHLSVFGSDPNNYGNNPSALSLNATSVPIFSSSGNWDHTHPTNTYFRLGDTYHVNRSGSAYIAYLFASLPGISKVGSYTGNGSTQTIDCGFTAGARFVLIKRTDTADAWYVWDSARGIVAGNDPYLQLNSTAAEVTSTDHIDPANSGFTLATSFLGTNNSAGTYIYLAIA